MQYTLITPVCLVGMPGCGKTTLGRELAKKLGSPFADSDRKIERTAGMSVTEYFKKEGEKAFRCREYDTLLSLTQTEIPCVIATGGGAFIQENTREMLLNHTATIWLKPSLPMLLSRVSRRNTRPLLETGDKETILNELAETRYPCYEQAHISIEKFDGSRSHMAERLLEALRVHYPSSLSVTP